MRRAVVTVIYGFLGTLLSGLMILAPLAIVIETRAAQKQMDVVAQAKAEITALVKNGSILVRAFPNAAALPTARRREPMRQALCEQAPLALQTPDVLAFASLCLTSDRTGRRFFAVGLSWREAAPIRGALQGLHALQDVAGLGWIAPQQMGILLHQDTWP